MQIRVCVLVVGKREYAKQTTELTTIIFHFLMAGFMFCWGEIMDLDYTKMPEDQKKYTSSLVFQ